MTKNLTAPGIFHQPDVYPTSLSNQAFRQNIHLGASGVGLQALLELVFMNPLKEKCVTQVFVESS